MPRIRADFEQPLRVLLQLVDAPVVHALAFEHAGGVVQPMGQYMDLRIAPGHEFAIEPDRTIAIVEGNH